MALSRSRKQANEMLKEVFGFNTFRASQQAIIDNVMMGRNTLAIMPTGGGKSLCYQIPALLFDGITVVISPLISLMQDQVRQLIELDISASVLNSALATHEYQQNIEKIGSGSSKLVFLAPETALQSTTISLLKRANVACVAIDEAHCISEWGHEFRPEYRQLQQLTLHFPDAVTIALTATATPRVRDDIKRQLKIDANSEFVSNFDRPNLYLEVTPKDTPYQQVKAFIDKHAGQSGIIYCQSRSGVDEVAAKLQHDGYKALAYHAGLSSQKRNDYQEQFVRDDIDIIVATIAFGMGINKPDVRFVLHYDLPKNIEAYYQQIGRAGRDGLDANCLLLFGYGDTGKIRFFIDQMQNEHEQRLATMHLNQMLALAETEDCRRLPLLQYFEPSYTEPRCNKCDNCLSEGSEKSDLTVPAQKFLSCVHRTGQLFGASHVIDVLRGSNAEKVLQNRHNLLSTYGIGMELSKKEWMGLGRQLIQKGLLRQEETYGSLKLTQSAVDVLKGRTPFLARLQKHTPPSDRRADTALVTSDQGLVSLLKSERKRLADEANVPPYAVFSDRSLHEMAYYFPHSTQSLLQIHGVGHAKVNKYGASFIEIISEYCASNNLVEVANVTVASSVKATPSKTDAMSLKSVEIVRAFESGRSINELTKEYKIKPNTLYSHLHKYVLSGQTLQKPEVIVAQIDLSQELTAQALDAFRECGSERLKPIFERLNEQVTYEQLHLLRVYFLHQINHRTKSTKEV
jgi:ATP-dependent DNA helicase RecQ